MSDVGKMVAIGLVWGVTNALMRRGALVWDRKLTEASLSKSHRHSLLHRRLFGHFKKWIDLLLVWQYSIPFIVNLSASALFFSILSDVPISVAVPVTNGTTFAATAVAAMALGEKTRVGHAFLGDIHQLAGEVKTHWLMLIGPLHLQGLGLEWRNLATKVAPFQSISTSPPLVALLSAFYMLE